MPEAAPVISAALPASRPARAPSIVSSLAPRPAGFETNACQNQNTALPIFQRPESIAAPRRAIRRAKKQAAG
jgi:hypothetical protein